MQIHLHLFQVLFRLVVFKVLRVIYVCGDGDFRENLTLLMICPWMNWRENLRWIIIYNLSDLVWPVLRISGPESIRSQTCSGPSQLEVVWYESSSRIQCQICTRGPLSVAAPRANMFSTFLLCVCIYKWPDSRICSHGTCWCHFCSVFNIQNVFKELSQLGQISPPKKRIVICEAALVHCVFSPDLVV